VLGGSPSAKDLRLLAGSLVAGLMVQPEDETIALREAARTDPSGVVSWLDQVAGDIMEIRRAIAGGDEAGLDELLAEAHRVRADWATLAQIQTAETAGLDEVDDYDATRHLLVGRLLNRRGK
jgi:hypothetical protein